MWSGIITAALLLIFVGGWLWAWSPRRKAGFDAAARLALEEKPATTPSDQASIDAESRP